MKQAPKKVLYVITKSNWGGAQRYVFDLATSLPNDQFEIVVALGGNGLLKKKLEAEGIATKNIVGLQRNVNVFKEVVAFFHLLILFAFSVRPDVVHLNSSKAAALGALAARITLRKKIIFTVHGWPFGEHRNALSRILIYLASWLTALLSSITVVLSHADVARGKRMLFVGSRIRHIPLGITQKTIVERSDARAAILSAEIAQRHKEDVWVTTIAELTHNKNLFTAIDAVAAYNETHLPRIFYCIIGRGALRDKLDAYLTRRRIREHVMLLDFIPEAGDKLEAFDVFFLPSRKEGLPYALLEAGLAKLPVVASDVGGIPDIIGSKEGILKHPDDIKRFSGALYEFVKDPERRTDTGRALYRKVTTAFSLERMVMQTIALYLPDDRPVR